MWAAQDLLLGNNHAGYNQFAVQQRSKTPGSLYNHTGLTPTPSGPISTPQSRDNSQPPEQPLEQPPDQMNWEDGLDESYSASPTSANTPPEQEMLDASQSVRDYYYGVSSTQATDVDMMDFPALPPSGFNEEGMMI